MNEPRRRDRFLPGLAAGALGGALAGGALALTPIGQSSDGMVMHIASTAQLGLDWASDNLGLSLPIFAFILTLFIYTLSQLRRRIEQHRPLDEVAQADHLSDTWTSLFFGVGVIWTAIGMRGALLFALGDPASTAREGAFAVLERMVDGGILVALSTTIFGGIGGYVMRVVKTVVVGGELKRYYDAAAQESADGVQRSLDAIEKHLERISPATSDPIKEQPRGPIAVD